MKTKVCLRYFVNDCRSALLLFININNLSDSLSSNAKLFADDTSLFPVVHDTNTSAIELNSDLKKNQ